MPWDEDELRRHWRGQREHGVLARLATGVTLAQAREEMDAIATQLEAEYPEMEGWGIDMGYANVEGTGFLRPALLVLLGAVAFVLLIACANVANLLLARANDRQREIALRAATGASRFRLLRQLLTESLLLGSAGGVGGLIIGYGGVLGLRAIMPAEVPLPGGDASIVVPAFGIDGTVLAFTAGVALVTGLVAGLLPAWQMSVVNLSDVLRGSDRASTSTKSSTRARNVLVAGEIALAVVLVVATFLMIETFWNLGQVDPGFRPDDLLTMQIELPTDTRYQTNDEEIEFYRQALAELESIPGVETAGLSEVLPLDNSPRRNIFRRLDDTGEGFGVDYNLVNPGFFEALRIPLMRGRMFDETDIAGNQWVTIVDETFAEMYFGGDAVGEQIVFWEREYEIVGVVGAVRSAGLDEQPRPIVYLHHLQDSDNFMAFILRARGGQEGLVEAAKEAIWRVDPEQPIFNVRRMDHVVAEGSSSRRLTLTLLSVFGMVALVMAGLGVYGVMSYAVAQRTKELGVRRALGADQAGLVRMVVGDAARLALAGVVVGALAAVGAGQALASLLYGVSPTQPLAFGLVAAVLIGVAATAALLPALRAARTDPMVALRAD